jgi:hypothetical protein
MHRWTSKQYQNLGKSRNIRIKEHKKEKLYRPESTHTENTLKNQWEIGPKTCCGKERERESHMIWSFVAGLPMLA